MQNLFPGKISIDHINLPLFTKQGLEVSVLRLDNIHPIVSGNKWFKLRYELETAVSSGKKKILTFGGAWSNHIPAAAFCAKEYGLHSMGIIRGEEDKVLSPALEEAKRSGMELVFITRDDYREKKIPAALMDDQTYVIEEGGYGPMGARGVADLFEIPGMREFTYIASAAGTGTTSAGLINGSALSQTIIAVSVLRNNHDLENNTRRLIKEDRNNFFITHDYHFGGYAKWQPALLDFMNDWWRETRIPSDFVYTGKMFFAIRDLILKNYFPGGGKILMIHTGGLAGNLSLSKGTLIF